MKSLSFKNKILLLVIIPIVLLSFFLTLIAIYQARELGRQNIDNFSETIYELRHDELRNYTELAIKAVEELYEDAGANEFETQQAARNILRDLEFGDDGYFFVYDYQGLNLVHPQLPDLEGQNLWSIQDSNGVLLIQELVQNARRGGGYTYYVWDKPSAGRDVDKIGYSLGLDRWKWMVGTGLYVDDLENAIANVQEEVDQNLMRTWLFTGLMAAASALLVGLIGIRFTMSEGKLADDRLKELSRKNVEAQEAERARVARQLQSGINKALVSAQAKVHEVMGANALEEGGAQKLSVAEQIIGKTVEEVYRIAGELRPGVLDEMGLYPAVDTLIEETKARSDIEFNVKKMELKSSLRPETETAVYRILQEALKNVEVHSSASRVDVRMRQTAGKLTLTIRDNGVGFNSREIFGKGNKAGIGFADMRVRAESLGGTFSVFSSPVSSSRGAGTMIKVELPI